MLEWWAVVAVVALVFGVSATLALVLNTRHVQQLMRQQHQSLETVQRDLRALCNAAVQVGARVNQLEQVAKELQQRQRELGLRQEKMIQPEPEARNFEQAIKLAQKGASVEELMDICGLSRGEAELMSMMHRLG